MKNMIARLQASRRLYGLLYGFAPRRRKSPAALLGSLHKKKNEQALARAVRMADASAPMGGAAEEAHAPLLLARQNHGGPADRLRFGLGSMAFCGCEILACYNALALAGRSAALPELIGDFEQRGACLLGLLGTAPAAICTRIQSAGLNARLTWAPMYRHPRMAMDLPPSWDDLFAASQCAVFTFWWPGQLLIHTVALQHDPSGHGLRAWNLLPEEDFSYYLSLGAMIRHTGIVPISLITIE